MTLRASMVACIALFTAACGNKASVPGPASSGPIEAKFQVQGADSAAAPSEDLNLKATAGDQRVELKWNAVDGATSYRVQRKESADKEFKTLLETPALEATDKTAANGVSYDYLVYALLKDQQISASKAQTVTPAGAGASSKLAPQELTAKAQNGQVTLTWKRPDENVRYLVARDNWGKGSYELVSKEAADTFVDDKPSPGALSYRVQAQAAAGTEDDLASVGLTLLPPPTDLRATAADQAITLTWSDVDDASDYVVGRRLATEPTFKDIATSAAATFADTTAVRGVTYVYSVRAGNDDGTGAFSASVQVSLPTVPPSPMNLKANAGNASVTLSWSSVPTATSYIVRRSTADQPTPQTIATQAGTSYTDNAVANDVTYSYVVLAKNAAGVGTASATVTVTPTPIPKIPQNFTATAVGNSVTLTWSAADGATEYAVKRTQISGRFYSFVGFLEGLTFRDVTVVPGNTYYYTVVASNDFGNSGNSVERAVLVLAAPSVTALSLESSIALSWPAVTGASGYIVKRAPSDTGKYELVAKLESPGFTDEKVPPNVLYNYIVTAVGALGSSNDSLPVSGIVVAPPGPENVLVVANAASEESVKAANYYLKVRPGFEKANYLEIKAPLQEIITEKDYISSLRDPIVKWLSGNPDKRIYYIVLMYGVPTRVSGPTAVQTRLTNALSEANVRSGRAYVSTSEHYIPELFPGTTALVTHVAMASLEDTIAYIDKIAATAAQTGAPGLTISAGKAGGSTYYFDDAGRIYAWSQPGAEVKAGILAANNKAQVDYESTNHIVNATDVLGYQTWGANGGQGGAYALDGKVKFQGRSNWYLISTIESYNGQADVWQGHINQWFMRTAFGGANYENTPAGAIGHTEEPYLGGTVATLFFQLWEKGYPFAECAWSSRATPYYIAVGDPLLTR